MTFAIFFLLYITGRLETKATKDLQTAQAKYKAICRDSSGAVSTFDDADLNMMAPDRSSENEKRGIMAQLYQETGVAKLPAVLEYLEDILENEESKMIIFAHHKACMDGISDFLGRQKLDFIRIDGSTSPLIRQDLCDHFQNSPNCRAALLGITSASVGLTLNTATLVIFAEVRTYSLIPTCCHFIEKVAWFCLLKAQLDTRPVASRGRSGTPNWAKELC